jgi:hypothetical protein
MVWAQMQVLLKKKREKKVLSSCASNAHDKAREEIPLESGDLKVCGCAACLSSTS